MLLALGLSAASAVGQNVTVIMKDNTVHKYSAEYLSEISFRDVTPGPEAVEFKTVGLNVFSGGNVTVTLTDESGNVKCETDLYGSTDAVFLQAGVYEYATTCTPYTFDPIYSSVTTESGRHKVTGGSVTVAYGPEQTSSIFREPVPTTITVSASTSPLTTARSSRVAIKANSPLILPGSAPS